MKMKLNRIESEFLLHLMEFYFCSATSKQSPQIKFDYMFSLGEFTALREKIKYINK